MRRKLDISAEAARNLQDVEVWLSQPGSGPRASRKLAQVRAAILDLRNHPCRYPVGDHDGVRERSVAGYRIFYEVHHDTGRDATSGDVTVLRVFGPGQDRGRL